VSNSGPDWGAYLSGTAAFAGTLFALVLAARQIRGPQVENQHRSESWAYLVDSIGVTVELGAAAALALLFEIEESTLFSVAVVLVALCGATLSFASASCLFKAVGDGAFNPDRTLDKWIALAQAVLNVLPLTCYTVAILYALRILHFGSGTWGYAAVVSWLTFSGVVQSIVWYARIWHRERPPRLPQASPVQESMRAPGEAV
jgi:hypothetical protein